MSAYNYVCLIGNLTFKPDLSYLPSGTPITKTRIAVNSRHKDKEGKEVEDPMFIDVTIWSKQAEICTEYLDKGSLVMITGSLRYNKWLDHENQPHSKHVLIARKVVFLSRSGAKKVDEMDEAEQAKRQAGPDGTPPVETEQGKDAEEKDEDIPF